MLGDITVAENIYIACGYTDYPRNIIQCLCHLQHLLLCMPDTEWQQYPEELDELMPWAPEVQEQCK